MPDRGVCLVSEYTHLGTVLRCDLSEIPNIRSRECLMNGMFRPVRAKLLAIGSGLWRLSTLHEIKAAEEPLAKVLRSSMQPVTGRSPRGLTVLQCAAALHLPTPQEMIAVECALQARNKFPQLYMARFDWRSGMGQRRTVCNRRSYACHGL